jgi:hypothetical protein
MAAEARRTVERHANWDGMHSFQTLRWDGERLISDLYAAIDPGFKVGDYPKIMNKLAYEHLHGNPAEPACAYMMCMEAHHATVPPDATDAERRKFHEDQANRKLNNWPGARELFAAYVADIHGRTWVAHKYRDDPEQIIESFCRPGFFPPGDEIVIRGLLGVALATGVLAWGLPAEPVTYR